MKAVVPIPGWTSFARRASVLLGALVTLSGPCSRVDAAAKGPKSIPVQIGLAEEMAANEDWDEAVRRWIEIIYYFGPSDQEARAEFEIGALALRRGRADLASSQWEKTIVRHPDSEWAERAREALKRLGKEHPSESAVEASPYVTGETPPDERQFLVAEGDTGIGLYVFAIRDYLKIPSLFPDSPRAAEARFRVGTCQALRGHPELALRQWQRLLEDYPDSPEAQKAGAAIAAWKAVLDAAEARTGEASLSEAEAEWRPFRQFATQPDRGLSYAEDLFENGILTYALQEYAKVLCDLYTPKAGGNPHKAYARYRMGVCAYRMGERDAAGRQWRRLLADFPDSPWAGRANQALAVVGVTDPFSSDAGTPSPAVPPDMPSPVVKRFHLAGQLVDCGLPTVALKEYLKVIHVLTAGNPNPFQAEATFRLGRCQQLRGRPNLALDVWQQVLDGFPDSPWAEKARAAIAQTRQCESALIHSAAPAEEGQP